ncbi:MAG TPA: hypothetical protein DCP63_02525 [Bacteroidetes bacterium]|nr:hypothetical protein [Bacteroidota bacterium]
MRSRAIVLFLSGLCTLPLLGNDFTIRGIKGTVEVRHGVTDEWKRVKVGDVLKPEDSMRTGKSSTAAIESEKKRLTVPEMTIIDISDVRELTQEEFLLKLAMENVLAVPPREKDEIMIPSATVLHGTGKGKEENEAATTKAVGQMQLHGAKVLYDNAFYATSILKSKETLRKYPELRSNYDARLMVASAFEKLRLNTQAVTEYSLLAKEDLTAHQLKKVRTSIDRLKQTK